MIKKVTLTLMLIFIFVTPIISSDNNRITKIKKITQLGSQLEHLLLSKNFNSDLNYFMATISGIDYIIQSLEANYRPSLFELELADDEQPNIIIYDEATSHHYQVICQRAEVEVSSHTPNHLAEKEKSGREERQTATIQAPTRVDCAKIDLHDFSHRKCRHCCSSFLSPENSGSTIAALISSRSSTDSFEPLNKDKK